MTVAESAIATDTFRNPKAVPVRIFGTLMLSLLIAFLINSSLTFIAKWPGSGSAFAGQPLGIAQLLIYALIPGLLIWRAIKLDRPSLRPDAEAVGNFNIYLIRALFWGVLLVGLTDAAISFLRVEGMLATYFGEDLERELGRSHYRGMYVHLPLIAAGFVIALLTPRSIGFHWLALLVVIAELGIVLSRFIFSYEQAFMGDLVRFWYAALFLFASAYTLFQEGHVRVDVLYAGFGPTTKGMVNAVGSIFLGMTFCWTILLIGLGGKSAIIASPLVNFEVSQSGFGMYVKYLMAGFLGVFAVTMLIQFVAYLYEAAADWAGEPGGRDHTSTAAH